MHKKQRIGRWGENLACQFLTRQGYVVLERNYHCRQGEIDIIAEKDQQLFFIEVKTRLTLDFGYPEEAFNWQKKERLKKAILSYLVEKEIESDDWQMGLVGIEVEEGDIRLKFYIY